MPQSSPPFVTVGATVGASNAGSPSIGLQGEVMHLASGFWAQGGGFFDLQTPSPASWQGPGGVFSGRRFNVVSSMRTRCRNKRAPLGYCLESCVHPSRSCSALFESADQKDGDDNPIDDGFGQVGLYPQRVVNHAKRHREVHQAMKFLPPLGSESFDAVFG